MGSKKGSKRGSKKGYDKVNTAGEKVDKKTDAMAVQQGRNQEGIASKATRNLNVIAAMVHLITDLLRSVLILLVALVIQLGGVEDAERTDAICALIVAFLVCAGSVLLLSKLGARVYVAYLRISQ